MKGKVSMCNFFDYDYCFCGNADKCPKKNKCKRAITTKPAGIYTYALFYKENEECEEFWEIENKGDKNEKF